MKMAVLGAGNIAGTMARTIAPMKEIKAYAAGSRDLSKARAFAEKFGFEKAFGSYEEMLQDPEIDLVYVATPHSHHYEHVRLCLEHGKNVLCEKAFTVNAAQARELLSMAEEKGLLLTEAIWTRYLPMRSILDGVLESGIIGELYSLTGNLCYVLNHVRRNQLPELAGGALLDLGVYPLNFACMTFKAPVKSVLSTCRFNEYGVDDSNSIILTFEDGKTATLHSSQLAASERGGMIYGSKGYIEVENINNCQGIRVFNKNYELIQEIRAPKQITGYEYEVIACMEALEKGLTECPQMPHSETIRMMELMDRIRADWGMKFPME